MLEPFPDGWFVPFQRSLTKPTRVAGVPFGFGVMNGTTTLALTLGGQQFWFALVGLGVHALAAAACKVDPYMFDVLKEHIHTKSYYAV